jgi:hypothetical protein
VSLYNLQDVKDTLKNLFMPGDVVELRALHTSRSGTVSGYFNDMDKLANASIQWRRINNSLRLNLSIDRK